MDDSCGFSISGMEFSAENSQLGAGAECAAVPDAFSGTVTSEQLRPRHGALGQGRRVLASWRTPSREENTCTEPSSKAFQCLVWTTICRK